MTDDLVKRLRHWQEYGPYRPSRYKEAADRIEQLEAALREMVNEKCEYMTINHLGDPETQYTIKTARKALGE
jgi:hypothetical protein